MQIPSIGILLSVVTAFVVSGCATEPDTTPGPATPAPGAGLSIPAHLPFSVHPHNPHYFLFRGEPTVLVTSGEHYGAMMNLDFDFDLYFRTLARDGLNSTRVFSGIYVEDDASFRITRNTLNPAAERYITPWARSDSAGYPDGGNLFDLERWDEAYFDRLHRFMQAASDHGIVVEYVVFCPFYRDEQWRLSPIHPQNNINGYPEITDRSDPYSLDPMRHQGLLEVHEKLVRKVVTELNGYDNLYFEVCNEPYQRRVPQDWHDHMAAVIVATERELPNKHLISWNVENEVLDIEDPYPAYGIFNFHYANPPVAIDLNWSLGRPIGDNETGFDGNGDRTYRTEAWEFMLNGGALFNHLDYSFAVGYERGDYAFPSTQPGGGGPTLRAQLGGLKSFIEGFDFIHMTPGTGFVKGGIPDGVTAYGLVDSGHQYALYLRDGGQVDLALDLPEGRYSVRWYDPLHAMWLDEEETLESDGDNNHSLSSPPYLEDIAFQIIRE